MNVMGIGPMEMGIIAVVALLVFGPGKLPEVMGQAGKMVRDFRKMSAELTGEFEKTIAEAKDATSGLSKELTGMSREVSAVTNSVKKDLNVSKTKSVNSARSSKPATTPAASKSTSTSSKVTRSTSSTKPAASKATTSPSAAKPKEAAKPTVAAKPKSTPAKATIPIASRDDPAADLSLFEPEVIERPRRNRRATPSIVIDPTPRIHTLDMFSADGSSSEGTERPRAAGDDAISRARARRRNAGYGQRVAGQ